MVVSKGRAALLETPPGAHGREQGPFAQSLSEAADKPVNISPFLGNAGEHKALPDSKLGLWRLPVLC